MRYGHRQVGGNDFLPARTITTGVGPVEVKQVLVAGNGLYLGTMT